MDNNTSPVFQTLRKTNPEFRKLEEEHHRLEIQLNELVRHNTLTPGEQVQKKRIQVEKLHTKDRMQAILRSSGGGTFSAARAKSG